jgi:NADH-quinone oxidoreductase subunit H
MAEYGSMFAVSGLASILFLGGWNGPIPIVHWLGLTADHGPIASYAGNFLGMLNFIFKCSIGVTFMMWIRWTLPRLRIDQVMKVCLKFCTPIAAVMFLGAVCWTYAFPGGLILPPSTPYAEVNVGTEDGSTAAQASPAAAHVTSHRESSLAVAATASRSPREER